MSIKWVVENACFEENADDFAKFSDTVFVRYRPFDFVTPFESDAILPDKTDHFVIFYGSINLGRRLLKMGYQWQIWLPDNVFDCNYWIPRFGLECWNSFEDSILIPFGSLSHYFMNNNNSRFFIRPNSGYKLFTGHTITVNDNIDRNLECIRAQYGVFPEDLILVSPAGHIEKEYRFVICQGLDEPFISSASQYKRRMELDVDSYVPKRVCNYVNDLLKKTDYSPAPAWTLDICFTDEHWVLETGSFTSAGLYDCDIKKIIEDVEKAVKEVVIK
jgi:hypothetical protein